MATITLTLVTTLSARIRDPLNTAHSTADIRLLLTHAQRIINSHTRGIVVEEVYPFPAGRTVGSTVDMDAVDRIDTVRRAGLDLPRVPWASLQHLDAYWLGARGTPQCWAPIGRMLFAVYPGPIDAETYAIVGPKITSTLASDGALLEVRDQHVPAILNIVEQLLLMRQRLFTTVQKLDERRPLIASLGEL